ncbi:MULTISPECIES: hypothetical protein [Chryseobacterium]|uniref:hypothetical protein n=1 Tax=Chryseobacterium TaxID=59732 RepID=UPI001CE2AEB5|nr:hypothetical protein [Chryseobacterium rhizoplanae]UCA58591.1 hypothetical protein KB553_16250 [Chryseobacterium rhizoplanae]
MYFLGDETSRLHLNSFILRFRDGFGGLVENGGAFSEMYFYIYIHKALDNE